MRGSVTTDTDVRVTTMWNESQTDEVIARARRQLRILIADDHPGTQRALQLVLGWLQCGSDVVENGREALEAVRSREYDVILMDVVMPCMDGLEATRQIRQERGFAARPRIVGMSADATPQDRDMGLASGMDDFLPKPIDLDSLIRNLDEAALGLESAS
jgi:CheY-like chemotaxis protein